MGYTFTKYGTGTDAIVFGTSKFDYDYDDDTFPSDAHGDFNEIVMAHGDVYSLQRQETTNDGLGNVIDVSNVEYRIYGMFQDITIKDRKIHEMGLAVPGNRKFYFKPSYDITSGGVTATYEIKEGDIINDSKLYTGKGNTGQFRVVKIIKQWYLPGTEVYRIAIVQNMNLDGTA